MSWLGDEINYNIRWYKPNDPYYWEVDNLPIQDLQDNCIKLQGQLNNIPDWGGFNDIATFDTYFLGGVEYNARRLEDLEGIDLIPNPEADDVFIKVGNEWNPSGFFKNSLKLNHQDINSDTRGLTDVMTSDNIPDSGKILKYNGTDDVWEDGVDKNFSTLLSHEGGSQTNSLENYNFVKYTSPTTFTNKTVTPAFSHSPTPTNGTIVTFSGTDYTPRKLISSKYYHNLPGQSGPFTRTNGANLLGGKDSSMDPQWSSAWTLANRWSNPYTVSMANEEIYGVSHALRSTYAHMMDDAYESGPKQSTYFTRMHTNTQGTADNWTAFKSQANATTMVIVLEDNSHFSGKFPAGIRYLSGWAHQRLNDLYNFESDSKAYQYAAFFTGHEDDPSRECATLCATDRYYFFNVMDKADETEVMIPVDNRGTYDSSTNTYTWDGKHRVYLDVACHNKHYINSNFQRAHGYSFLRVNINGWIT